MSDKGFQLILPPVLGHKFYIYGEVPTDALPGDIFIIRHGKSATKEGLLAAAISSGEHVLATLSEPDLKDYCWPDHVAVCSAVENGIPILSELGPGGFETRSLVGYQAECFAHIRLDLTDAERASAMAYNQAMAGSEYGWLQYFDIALDAITHAHFTGTWGDTIICSTHVSLVLMGTGKFFPNCVPTAVIPAHFAYWFNIPTPANLKVIEEEAMTTAILVNAHAVSRQLHETVYTPTHPKRGSSSSEFRETKAALIKESPNCYICGRTAEESGSPLELHHTAVEWSLANSADLTKIQEYYPQAKSIEQFLDSVDNGTILCARCHRSPLRGVHMITFPAWVVQKYQLDNWDLVNGPNHTSMAALDNDQSGYYPEH